MRRIILTLVAGILATIAFTAVESGINGASASSACNISTAPSGGIGSYAKYVSINGVSYRASCVSWNAAKTAPNQVRVYGSIRDTATDGCFADFAYRLYINGVPGGWKALKTGSETAWATFSQPYTLSGTATGIEVQAYRECAGGATSLAGDSLYYRF